MYIYIHTYMQMEKGTWGKQMGPNTNNRSIWVKAHGFLFYSPIFSISLRLKLTNKH